jgi:hypothetical protein
MMKILILLQLVVNIAASVGNGVYADEWPAIQHGEPMDVR